MSVVGRARRRLLSAVGRSPSLAALTLRLAAAVARRRGADETILRDAVTAPGRPLERSLQLVRWASAMAGTGTAPRHFTPGDHLTTADARAAAADLLRARAESDLRAQRDLIHVADDDLEVVRRRVDEHLTRLVTQRASRPQRGHGIDPDLQTRIVDELTRALGEIGVRPFLMSGTLLGFVREGSLLPHDYDIDLGLMPGEDLAAIEATVSTLGPFAVSTVGTRVVAAHETGVSVDLFAHELRDGRFWHATLIHEWWNTPFELVRDQLEGVDVWVPDEPERYLDENYGRWDVSVPFYDISFDTPNRVYRQHVDTLRFLHSRCVLALERGDRWLLESAVRELRDTFDIDLSGLLAPSRLLGRL